jgi:predicted nucleotidyltransferase
MAAREDALRRFRDACQRDPSIVAAFVGGSIAAHTDDDVSDVDLYAVTLEGDYDQFFTRRKAFMYTWTRPLLVVDTLNFEGLSFDMVHFVLDDGLYGELALGHTGNFRVMHGGPHDVLVDKSGCSAA